MKKLDIFVSGEDEEATNSQTQSNVVEWYLLWFFFWVVIVSCGLLVFEYFLFPYWCFNLFILILEFYVVYLPIKS